MGLNQNKIVDLYSANRICRRALINLGAPFDSPEVLMNKIIWLKHFIVMAIVGLLLTLIPTIFKINLQNNKLIIIVLGAVLMVMFLQEIFWANLYISRISKLHILLSEGDSKNDGVLNSTFEKMTEDANQIMHVLGAQLVGVEMDCGPGHLCAVSVRKRFKETHDLLRHFNLVNPDHDIYTRGKSNMGLMDGSSRIYRIKSTFRNNK